MKSSDFLNILFNYEIIFFTGVPDALLNNMIQEVDSRNSFTHICAANEGNAIAIAAGYYLATGKIPCVYMQNSGIGNALNPLSSLCSNDMFSIPMILIIGWRGEPDTLDEPQHKHQGRTILPLLAASEIPFVLFDKDEKDGEEKIVKMISMAQTMQKPVAIIIRKTSLIDSFHSDNKRQSLGITMNDAARTVINWMMGVNCKVFITTGHASRSVISIMGGNALNNKCFYNFGAMGHISQLALGYALCKPQKLVVCIDGDGANLMHLGGLTTIAYKRVTNFVHILFDNASHGSTGGQNTCNPELQFERVAHAIGYPYSIIVSDCHHLNKTLNEILVKDGPTFIRVLIDAAQNTFLPRPKFKPIEIKKIFME